jgi:hypothetical protein
MARRTNTGAGGACAAGSWGHNGAAGVRRELSKRFFFEKKKQKTFVYCGLWHLLRQGPTGGKVCVKP